MSFHEVRFPPRLSRGSSGGPERLTEVVTLANGHEERNSPWEHSRRRYDAGVGMRSLDDLEELVAFFEARRGRLYGFRWKDWSDYKSAKPSQPVQFDDQVIGVGDGQTRVFKALKRYASGAHFYDRPVAKLVQGTVAAGIQDDALVDGVHFETDYEKGTITFFDPPPQGVNVMAGFEFDVPVRFDVDAIAVSVQSFHAGEIPDVPVVEVKT